MKDLTEKQKGISHVGDYLLQYLHKEGATLTITDINETHLRMRQRSIIVRWFLRLKYMTLIWTYMFMCTRSTVNDNTIANELLIIVGGK